MDRNDALARRHKPVLPTPRMIGDPMKLMLRLEQEAERRAAELDITPEFRPHYVRLWSRNQYDRTVAVFISSK